MINIDFYQVIDLIKKTGQRGQELLVDSFILGVGYGREQLIKSTRQITTISEMEIAVTKLFSIKQEIDQGNKTPFFRDDLFNKYLEDKTFSYFNQDDNFVTNLSQQKSTKLKPKQMQQESVVKQNNFNDTCSICKFSLTTINDQEIFQLQICGHRFHIKCLYLHTQQYNNTCPICQVKIVSDVPDMLFEKLSDDYKSCCPNPTCNNEFIYDGQLIYYCSLCQHTYCLNCKKKNHLGQDCEVGNFGYYEMKMGEKFKCCDKCQSHFFLYDKDDPYRYRCQCFEAEEKEIMGRFKQLFYSANSLFE